MIMLDGNSLDCGTLLRIGEGVYQIALSDESWARIRNSRKLVDDILKSGKGIIFS